MLEQDPMQTSFEGSPPDWRGQFRDRRLVMTSAFCSDPSLRLCQGVLGSCIAAGFLETVSGFK